MVDPPRKLAASLEPRSVCSQVVWNRIVLPPRLFCALQHGLISNVLTLLQHQIFIQIPKAHLLSFQPNHNLGLLDVSWLFISQIHFSGEIILRTRSPTPDLRFAHPDLKTFQWWNTHFSLFTDNPAVCTITLTATGSFSCAKLQCPCLQFNPLTSYHVNRRNGKHLLFQMCKDICLLLTCQFAFLQGFLSNHVFETSCFSYFSCICCLLSQCHWSYKYSCWLWNLTIANKILCC